MGAADLHLHSLHSTDSGSFALRRARIGESFTDPERAYRVCKTRGLTWVTLSDHNTVEGALRIAHHPDAFVSVEVTTRFPEDDVPLHVLVWDLTEEDHRDLQPYRPSVYELVCFLQSRGLRHALAHPLYRMGPPITLSHVERMMLLFGLWEGRNGARPREQNLLACRLASAVTPAYLEKLAQRHGVEPTHAGRISLTAGSDDHGALDIATTFTEAPGETVQAYLDAIATGSGRMTGTHGSTEKLAHALAALTFNAYRGDGGRLAEPWHDLLVSLLDDDAPDAAERHAELSAAATHGASALRQRASMGGLRAADVAGLGGRLGTLLTSGALLLPYLATAHHHAGSRSGLREIQEGFFGLDPGHGDPRVLVFTDTFAETNGVAATMRRLAHAAADGQLEATVVTCADEAEERPGLIALEPEWTLPLPGYEAIELRFPPLLELLHRVEAERPDVVHVATPGPVGLCGLLVATLLGVPVVGSYHTELGPYALHVTRDVLVAEATGAYVDWFYRHCGAVLAPTKAVAAALRERGFSGRLSVWGRSVDTERFAPTRRSEELRDRLVDDGDLLLLSVGRVSPEKRLDLLLRAYEEVRAGRPGARLVIAGDGPAREALQDDAPAGVRFLGEVRGQALAELYASSDIFAFPSTTDTFGQVLIEAGASGLPTVATRAGGTAELVRHERTGLLVPPDDASALAAALLRLAGSPTRRARFGLAARSVALERSWARSLAELEEAYAEAATPAAVRSRSRAGAR